MSNDALKFTVENGQIAAVYEFDDGAWQLDGPDRDETWAWRDGNVTQTQIDDGRTVTKTYTDIDGDGVYFKASENYAVTATSSSTLRSGDEGRDDGDHATGSNGDNVSEHDAPGIEEFDGHSAGLETDSPDQHVFRGEEKYSFDIQNGAVVQASKIEQGVFRPENPDSNESYRLDGADVLKIETKANGQEITRYTDSDGDGFYVKLLEQWVGAAGDAAAPRITDPLSHVHSDGADDIAVRGGSSALGGQGADRFVVREAAHLEIGDFDAFQADKIVFDTGLGLQSFEQLLSFVTNTAYDGQDFVVEFGEHVSLTLVGVDPTTLAAGDFEVLS